MQKDPSSGALSQFAQLCAKFQNPEDLQALLDLFLTIEEKRALAARYCIVKALLDGDLTQREIAQTSNVSIAQITRGSNALKIISPELRELVRRYMQS
jgi:TrpR family trp operon transcriptional repressor